MWPFARFTAGSGDAMGPVVNVAIEAQRGPGQRTRTKSSSEINPISKRTETLRPSVSSASLKSTPQRPGLRIQAASALSQSSSVLAKGQITPLPPGASRSTPNQMSEPLATSSTPLRDKAPRQTDVESLTNENPESGSKRSEASNDGRQKQVPDVGSEPSGKLAPQTTSSYPFPVVIETERPAVVAAAIVVSTDAPRGRPEPASASSPGHIPPQGPEPDEMATRGGSAALANLQSLAQASAIPTINLTRATGSEGSPPPVPFLKAKETKVQVVPELVQVLKDDVFSEPASTRSARVTSFKIMPIQEASTERLPDTAPEQSPPPIQNATKHEKGKKSVGKNSPVSPESSQPTIGPETTSNRQCSKESRVSDQSSISTLIMSETPATTVQRVASAIGNALAWTALPGVASPRKASSNSVVARPPSSETGRSEITPSVPTTSPFQPEAPIQSAILPNSGVPGSVPSGNTGAQNESGGYAARIAVLPATAMSSGNALLVDPQTISEGIPGQLHVLPTSVEIPAHFQPILAALPDLPQDQVVPLLNGCLPIPLIESKPSIRRAVKSKARKRVVVHWLNALLGRQVAGVTKPVMQNLPQPSVRAAIKAKFRHRETKVI